VTILSRPPRLAYIPSISFFEAFEMQTKKYLVPAVTLARRKIRLTEGNEKCCHLKN
jgi:hypothetical protein